MAWGRLLRRIRMKMNLKRDVTIKQRDIDDIMAIALDGGITYWCDRVEVVGGKYYGENASDQISRGGKLKLYDAEEDEQYTLTLTKLLKGIEAFIKWDRGDHEIVDRDGKINVYNIDAEITDQIIQLALFGEVIYG